MRVHNTEEKEYIDKWLGVFNKRYNTNWELKQYGTNYYICRNNNGVPNTLVRGTTLRDISKALDMWISLDYYYDIQERTK